MTEQSSEPTAEGLTEAERRAFWQSVCEWNDVDDGFGRNVPSNGILFAAVERILADRLAAVKETEWRAVAASNHARAESAEAERDTALAALDRMKALADEWCEDYPSSLAACSRDADQWWRDLRAVVEGGRP